MKIKTMNILHFILMKNSVWNSKASNVNLSSTGVNLENPTKRKDERWATVISMDICQVYLLVSMVIRIDVVVKFLVFVVLLVTQFTVEVSLHILQSLGCSFLLLSIVLQRQKQRETLCYRSWAHAGFVICIKNTRLTRTANSLGTILVLKYRLKMFGF